MRGARWSGGVGDFTLMELLVLIAILGALAGISIRLSQVMIGKSRQSACLGNLPQIGVAVGRYVGDHAGELPDLDIGRESKASDAPVLETVLLSYLENEDAFRCPADFEEFEKTGCSYHWNHTQSGRQLSQLAFFGEERRGRIPLVSDKEDWHPGGTNFLYADYSSSSDVRFVTGEE